MANLEGKEGPRNPSYQEQHRISYEGRPSFYQTLLKRLQAGKIWQSPNHPQPPPEVLAKIYHGVYIIAKYPTDFAGEGTSIIYNGFV